jgi:hypothetical protein
MKGSILALILLFFVNYLHGQPAGHIYQITVQNNLTAYLNLYNGGYLLDATTLMSARRHTGYSYIYSAGNYIETDDNIILFDTSYQYCTQLKKVKNNLLVERALPYLNGKEFQYDMETNGEYLYTMDYPVTSRYICVPGKSSKQINGRYTFTSGSGFYTLDFKGASFYYSMNYDTILHGKYEVTDHCIKLTDQSVGGKFYLEMNKSGDLLGVGLPLCSERTIFKKNWIKK